MQHHSFPGSRSPEGIPAAVPLEVYFSDFLFWAARLLPTLSAFSLFGRIFQSAADLIIYGLIMADDPGDGHNHSNQRKAFLLPWNLILSFSLFYFMIQNTLAVTLDAEVQ